MDAASAMSTLDQEAGSSTRPRYSTDQKLEIVRYARANSVRGACETFGVARSSIYLWTRQKITALDSLRAPQTPTAAEAGSEAIDTLTPEAIPTASTPTGAREQLAADGPAPTAAPTAPAERAEDTRCATNDASLCASTNDYTACAASPPDDAAVPTVVSPMSETATRIVLVGYLGARCSFPYVAAHRTFAEVTSPGDPSASAFELTGYPHASHLVDALRKQEVHFAFVATDLLLSSAHNAILGQVVASRLKMVGEVIVEEDASVCALPGTELCDADCVIADWRTLQRYEEYIVLLERQYNRAIYRQVVWDSTTGCQTIHEEQAAKTIVLCTASAAATYGLVVLRGHLPGSPTHTRYTILGRCGENPLTFARPDALPTPYSTTASRALLVNGTTRAILDIVSAFAFRGLDILSFQTRDGDERHLRSYLICYRASTNHLVEIGLHDQLGAASERVVMLGEFETRTI